MKIYLQHRGTKRFLSTWGEWTEDETEARSLCHVSGGCDISIKRVRA
jgi:hypothetical protein